MSAPSGQPPHYQARQNEAGWYFTTPVGPMTGYPDRFTCLRMAANTERADRYAAATSTQMGEREQKLRDHFFPDGLPTPPPR